MHIYGCHCKTAGFVTIISNKTIILRANSKEHVQYNIQI